MPFFAWLMFRLTSHWKRPPCPGSSRIGNDLPVQAHPALDNSPHSQPTFAFANLLTLVQDQPTTEGGVMYDPTTGQPVLWSWNAASSTWGLLAEDTWKAAKNLTLTLGLRWDDSGNPYSRSATTVFGNFRSGMPHRAHGGCSPRTPGKRRRILR